MMALDQPHSMKPPLLRTKITVPVIPPKFVHRPRLTQRIDRGAMGPLTLLIHELSAYPSEMVLVLDDFQAI
jgi:ATP/maltotriose-dependent transcriptional regulator MalT